MKKISVCTYLLLLGAVVVLNAQVPVLSNGLKMAWTLSEGLSVPESAHFNPFDSMVYVSNIVGKHDLKDGVGYISKVSLKGELIEKEWLKGVNAPKGMYSTKNKLFVTDYDRVLEVDLETGTVLKTYHNAKSKDLNDVAIASDGTVYITDSGSKCLFRLEKDSMLVYMEDDRINGMNGIYIEQDALYIGAQGKLLAINIKTKSIEVVAEDVGYVDGIKRISQQQFISSDWKGTVRIITIGQGSEKVLDTSSENVFAADLEFIKPKGLVLVPTFFNNSLVAYQLTVK